jgi:hypothetical protein
MSLTHRSRVLRCGLAALLLAIAIPAFAAVTVYPAPAEDYRSPAFKVRVVQDGKPLDSFVYGDRNPEGNGAEMLTRWNHWTTFAFDGPIHVEIEKTGGDFGAVTVHPLAREIRPKVEGNRVSFTLDKPAKLYIKDAAKADEPLFIFADPPETEVPDRNDPNVVWFEGGKVHRIGGQYKVESGKSYYIEGGAYVIGTLVGEGVSDVRILGRGVLSGIDYPRHGSSRNMHWNAINLSGDGSNQIVDGITITNPSHFCILSRGEMHVRNVKMFGWWVQTDGFGGGTGSSIADCFLKVNDDHVKLYNSDMAARDLVIYQQNNGAIFQLGWGPNGGAARNCRVSDIDVVASEPQFKMRALIEFHSNDGKTVHDFDFHRIRVDQDLWRMFAIENRRGTTKNFTIEDVLIRGALKNDGEINAGSGEVANFAIKALRVEGKPVKTLEEARLSFKGNVTGFTVAAGE